MEIPEHNVALFVSNLAKAHNITFVRTHLDVWAEKITELSGDTVKSDATLDLLVALKKANIITSSEMAQISIKHLREIKNIH